ncbi:hypothetical protein ACFV85_14800 [Streptomyces niveus]|uniref:hypothetical protein n=1 Tax=Streptomyces niveus TaxID=193462 RepID=UPI00364A4E16
MTIVSPTQNPHAPEAEVRDALMRALAAAETAISRLPVMPTSVSLDEYRGRYTVSLFYSQDAGAVRQFATSLDLESVQVAPNQAAPETCFTEATAYVGEISVRAWTLLNSAADDVAGDRGGVV